MRNSMNDKPCPNCGSTKRRKRYNKWHIREISCAECHRSLNSKEVWKRTRMAEIASKEGKLDDFYLGTYKPTIPKEEYSEVSDMDDEKEDELD